MECSRGSVCKESDHIVKTLKIAQEWHEGITESMLPVKVNQVTAANGRVQIKIRDRLGGLVYVKG